MFLTAWLLLLALEIAWADVSLLEMRPIQEGQSNAIAEAIACQPVVSGFSHQPLAFPRSQQPSVASKSVEGISPLQLAAYREYLAAAVGFNPGEYSIPIPPLAGAINLDAYDFNRLADLNVAWMLSDAAARARQSFRGRGARGGVHLPALGCAAGALNSSHGRQELPPKSRTGHLTASPSRPAGADGLCCTMCCIPGGLAASMARWQKSPRRRASTGRLTSPKGSMKLCSYLSHGACTWGGG